MEETQDTKGDIRNPDGTFAPGRMGGPGRPRNTMKDYLKRKFSNMDDMQKEEWLKDHKVPGLDQIKLAEGNPHQSTETELKGGLNITFARTFKDAATPLSPGENHKIEE